MRYLAFQLIIAVTFWFPAFSQTPVARVAATQHSGTFHEVSIRYTATVKETILTGGNGKPVASMITTTYVADGAGQRPVIFVFNGGPGASSSPLHMHAFGPQRIVFNANKSGSVLIPNKYSPLDFTDLVFIDPVGTGYTELIDSVASESFWDVEKDATNVIDLIKSWKTEHHREDSPIYICGESYGTTRAAAIMGQLNELQLAGVIMLSTLIDFGAQSYEPGNEMVYALNLPTMTCAAWYHHKIARKFKTVGEVYEDAYQFAQNEYLPALIREPSMTVVERQAVANKLESYTGLKASILLEKNLRVKVSDYVRLLLADNGKRIGMYDAQVQGPLNTENVKPPYDDPSMTSGPPTRPAINQYFNDALKFPSQDKPYTTINFYANSKWIWHSGHGLTAYFSLTSNVIDAMKKQPALRLMVAGGYFDLATSLYGARYSLEHSGVDRQRTIYAQFPTGHGIFENEESLDRLVRAIREFVQIK